MSDQPLPENIKKRYKVRTTDEMWRKMLTEGNSQLRRFRHIFGMLPTDPRCANCNRPFAGAGGALLRAVQGVHRSTKNNRFCTDCHSFVENFPGGAEVKLTMLFADVRGSTAIAEKMSATEFGRLMNRFYDATIRVLVRADAFIDNLIGDEVSALFIPGFAGPEHAHRAVEAGQELLKVTGHKRPGGPWLPVGIGVHTGRAWVGSVGGTGGDAADFTALGDNVNIAARLTSQAGPGELLVSEAAYEAARIQDSNLEMRKLELKGKSEAVSVHVLKAA